MRFQPQLHCSVDQLEKCFSAPPLLLVLSVPASDIQSVLQQFSTKDERYAYLASLIAKTSDSKRFWKYLCKARGVLRESSYDCFDPVSAKALFSGVHIYRDGLFFPSSAGDYRYSEFLKDDLPGYISEYVCHPSQPHLIQLRQYHVGPSFRRYYRGQSLVFNNPTGRYTTLMRITTFDRTSFVQENTNKPRKLGFSMDPAGIGPIIDKVVPNSLR